MPILSFLEHTPTFREQAALELGRIRAPVASPGAVALDPQAVGYVQFPLDWAPQPNSLLRSIFDDATINAHLEVLAARQQPDGGQPIKLAGAQPCRRGRMARLGHNRSAAQT